MDDKLRKKRERVFYLVIGLIALGLIFTVSDPSFTGFVTGNFTVNITENITINESVNVTIGLGENITANITKYNETVNISIEINETNITLVENQEQAVLEVMRSGVEINKSVKWTKKIEGSKIKEYKLPETSFNIKTDQEVDIIEKVVKIKNKEVIEIEYFTEGPTVKEKSFGRNRKQITVSSELHYEDVLTYTSIAESREDLIKVFWLKDSGKELFKDIEYIDTNNNGLIDKLQWVIPHLSSQTFEIIIEITKAEHLDENKEFISNIYDEVIYLDNIWSERIYHNEFIRVTFEKNLTIEKDITVYVRNTQQLDTKIEVYYHDSSIKITEFHIIEEEKYYKIYLTDMEGMHDKFDLKIINEDNNGRAYLEFNHIVDPSTPVVYHLITQATNKFTNVSPTGTTVTQTCYVSGGGGTCDYTFVRSTAYLNTTNITTNTITGRLYWDTDTCAKTGDCNLNAFYVYHCGTDPGCGSPTTICTGAQDTTCSSSTEPCFSDISCTPSTETKFVQNEYLGFRVTMRSKQKNVYLRYNSSTRDSWFNVTEDPLPPNNDPEITWINSSVSENPIEAGARTIYIQFNATDQDGVGNLNDNTASIYLNMAGEITRFNNSCTPRGNSGNTETYDCAIDMLYYDKDGQWTINASIRDTLAYVENTTETFTYGSLTAMVLGKTSMNFTNAKVGQQDVASSQNPQIINNRGNQNITEVNITAFDLIKGVQKIEATYFTANATEGNGYGYQLQNNTMVTIVNSFIPRDINGNDQNGTIYLYVDLPATGITSGIFNSYTDWLIDVQ